MWTRLIHESHERAKPLSGLPPHGQPFAGNPDGTPAEREAFDSSRLNFLALIFCLMVGTAGLPHLLTRFYTTPSVREARQSVVWTLGFIVAVYVSAPALAILVKLLIYDGLVGSRFSMLPSWVYGWRGLEPGLLGLSDVNGDGLVQFAEIRLNQDMITLATPEIAGLPHVVSGLVAAGALAAALSTADGLLLTIANALSHDLYFRTLSPGAPTARRVLISKLLLLLVAAMAAMIASSRPAGVLDMVAAAFSLSSPSYRCFS